MSNSCESGEKPGTFKERIRTWNFWKTVIGVALGVAGGYLYYHFEGCASGACAITGNPWSSMLMGGLFGLFLTNRSCGC